jgi:hypothetical protein
MGITLAFGGDRREASSSVGECDVTRAWWKNPPGTGIRGDYERSDES